MIFLHFHFFFSLDHPGTVHNTLMLLTNHYNFMRKALNIEKENYNGFHGMVTDRLSSYTDVCKCNNVCMRHSNYFLIPYFLFHSNYFLSSSCKQRLQQRWRYLCTFTMRSAVSRSTMTIINAVQAFGACTLI